MMMMIMIIMMVLVVVDVVVVVMMMMPMLPTSLTQPFTCQASVKLEAGKLYASACQSVGVLVLAVTTLGRGAQDHAMSNLNDMSHVTCHTSYITRQTSHVTHLTSHITRHLRIEHTPSLGSSHVVRCGTSDLRPKHECNSCTINIYTVIQ